MLGHDAYVPTAGVLERPALLSVPIVCRFVLYPAPLMMTRLRGTLEYVDNHCAARFFHASAL